MLAPEHSSRISDLARVLSVAWKNVTSYPPGHPTFVASLSDAHRRVVELASLPGALTFGVARNGLILDDEKLDSPHAQRFAEALYRREVALLTIDRGVEPWEIETLFRLTSADPRGTATVPLAQELESAGVTGIRLQSIDYSGVRTTEGVEAPLPKRDLSLLDEILRELISGRPMSAEGTVRPGGETAAPEGLMEMLLRHLQELDPATRAEVEAAGGSGLPGSGMSAAAIGAAIGDRLRGHLRHPAAGHRQTTIHQLAELMRNLPPEIRRRIIESALEILAGDVGAEQELRSLARVLSPDEVFHALSALRKRGADFSPHALSLLENLMVITQAHAKEIPETGDPEVSKLASEIEVLLGEEDIDRYNPPEHRELIEEMSLEIPARKDGSGERARELGRERLGSLGEDAVTLAMRTAILEMLPRRGAGTDFQPVLNRIEGQFLELLGTMQVSEAMRLARALHDLAGGNAPAHLQTAARQSIERIGAGESIKALVDWLHLANDELIPEIQRIIDLFGSVGTRNFLFALAEEQDRSRRRRIFDFLAGLGPQIVPDATSLLSDSRWYVVRNMIALLRSVGDRSSLPELRKLTTQGDIRVRLEAIKSLLALDTRVPEGMLERAIEDPDPKLAETAVVLCGSYAIKEAEEPLLRLVLRKDWFGRKRSIRLKAMRALAELGRSGTLERLEPILRERRFASVAPEERRYAYELLEYYPVSARGPWVEIGLESRDAAVREIAQRLARRRDRVAPESA